MFRRHVIKLVLVLLALAAASLFAQAYRTASQERAYHQAALSHSVDATAREVALYIDGIRRALALFADQERHHLATLIANAGWHSPADRVREQLRRYFPDHLAFAIADPLANSVLPSEAELFGNHCRLSLDAFLNDPAALLPAPSIHTSGAAATQHFDILAPVPDAARTGDDVGTIFVSFRIGVLHRLLERGGLNGHRLVLSEANPTALYEETVLVGHTPVANPEALESVLGPLSIPADAYRLAVAGTPWQLAGWLDPELTTRARRGALRQALVGCLALVLAGALVYWAMTKEKLSRSNTNKIIDNVEADRKRIARDLHDQVLADISHLRRLVAELKMSRGGNKGLMPEHLHLIEQNIALFSDGIRAAIDDLYPHTLELLGLRHSIDAYVEKRCQNGPLARVDLSDEVDSVLRPEQKLQLFRITAELVNNALHHSGCRQLRVELAREHDAVKLAVQDDGVGFDRRKSQRPGCYGLANIETRAASLGARIRWLRPTTGGSRFELELAVRTPDDESER